MTEKILIGAVGNNRHGLELVKYLLDAVEYRSEKDNIYSLPFKPSRNIVPVTEEVLKIAAADEEYGLEMITRLLDCSAADNQITEAVMLKTRTNQRNGKEIRIFLSKRCYCAPFALQWMEKKVYGDKSAFLPHQDFLESILGEREHVSPGVAYG